MRLIPSLLLVFGLAACAGSNHIRPGDTWYVVPTSDAPVNTYARATGPDPSGDLAPGERYQVVGRHKGFYQVRAANQTAPVWITINEGNSPVPYNAGTHGTAADLDRSVAEHRNCSSFSTPQEARAALEAGNTRLDADGDGQPCENGVGRMANRRAPAASRGRSSGTNCHWVSGYTRKNGTRVRGHRRCR